jgi:hypothetical protein
MVESFVKLVRELEFPNLFRAVRRPPVWAVHQDSPDGEKSPPHPAGDIDDNSRANKKVFQQTL